MAVASMVLGILSMYTKLNGGNSGFAFILGSVSVILGIIVITSSNAKQSSVKGMVITAFILSGLVLTSDLLSLIPEFIKGVFTFISRVYRNIYWYY